MQSKGQELHHFFKVKVKLFAIADNPSKIGEPTNIETINIPASPNGISNNIITNKDKIATTPALNNQCTKSRAKTQMIKGDLATTICANVPLSNSLRNKSSTPITNASKAAIHTAEGANLSKSFGSLPIAKGNSVIINKKQHQRIKPLNCALSFDLPFTGNHGQKRMSHHNANSAKFSCRFVAFLSPDGWSSVQRRLPLQMLKYTPQVFEPWWYLVPSVAHQAAKMMPHLVSKQTSEPIPLVASDLLTAEHLRYLAAPQVPPAIMLHQSMYHQHPHHIATTKIANFCATVNAALIPS